MHPLTLNPLPLSILPGLLLLYSSHLRLSNKDQTGSFFGRSRLSAMPQWFSHSRKGKVSCLIFPTPFLISISTYNLTQLSPFLLLFVNRTWFELCWIPLVSAPYRMSLVRKRGWHLLASCKPVSQMLQSLSLSLSLSRCFEGESFGQCF